MSATLLVVDDDQFMRSITLETLTKCGYAVESAEDGVTAWEQMDGDPGTDMNLRPRI